MNNQPPSRRSIQLLREDIAQKIAAGEVIDRPAAVVRELLDNSLDAGADAIDLYLEEGGISSVRVVDNGWGMSKEDLKLCYLPHSTSKISTLIDLEQVTSLGFRGEALASIAVCARLTITSLQFEKNEDPPGNSGSSKPTPYRLRVENGKLISLEPAPGNPGTVTEVRELFYSVPGRKKFLKSKRAEGTACKGVFQEKALAFPEVAFRLFMDGELKLYLPAGSLIKRAGSVYGTLVPPAYLRESKNCTSDDNVSFSINAVLTSPDFFRKDRKGIKICVNRRRIDEFSLVQAVEYAYRSLLPGGAFPGAFVFITIQPELVDFNVHPAKKEARFKNLPEIHHLLTQTVKQFLSPYTGPGKDLNTEPENTRRIGYPNSAGSFGFPANDRPLEDIALTRRLSHPGKFIDDRSDPASLLHPKSPETPSTSSGPLYSAANSNEYPFTYLGQVFNLFLIAETSVGIFFIDQHAAHETMLYRTFLSTAAVHNRQPLLVPLTVIVEEEERKTLRKNREELHKIGIDMVEKDEEKWEITSLPGCCPNMEWEIIEFITTQIGTPDDLRVKLFADLACKKAVKEGTLLGPRKAMEIIEWVLDSGDPRCPHGRPLFFKVTKEELLRHVGRVL